jgi:hypothetical protein
MEVTLKLTKLPPANREEQMERWGIRPGRLGDHLFGGERRGHLADDAPADEEEDDSEDDGSARAFLFGEDGHGVSVVDTARSTSNRGTHGARDAGMTAHRGVLDRLEWVDFAEVARQTEAGLGFTRQELARVSGARGGRPRKADAVLSDRVNARLAELRAEGSNFAVLAQVLGVTPQALGERAKRGAGALAVVGL